VPKSSPTASSATTLIYRGEPGLSPASRSRGTGFATCPGGAALGGALGCAMPRGCGASGGALADGGALRGIGTACG
jgi:hypothetical protein